MVGRSTFVREKLKRLADGQAPRVVDLFAGSGGLSLGCKLAGAEILAAVEFDPFAARTHAINFHHQSGPDDLFEVHARARDISATPPDGFLRELYPDAKDFRGLVDVLVGGPPCQAFARVGRAKLREIMQHPEAFLNDPRAQLFHDYLRYVEALHPAAVLMENVPDVLNFGGVNIFEAVATALEAKGYECVYGLLNSAHYGVPQMRERCFLLGVSRQAGIPPLLPEPTHEHSLPRGYQGTRDVALRSLRTTLFDRVHYSPAPIAALPPRPVVTAGDALADMPKIMGHLKGKITRGARRFDTALVMGTQKSEHYFRNLMRLWPGFESDGYVYDHVIRYLPRDYALFGRMKPGDQYPQAHALGKVMRDEAVARLERERGGPISPSSKLYAEMTARFVPPYDPGKFPNKWRKMEADAPARTLMAHLGKDTYSHIHFDSKQARPISVREGARLQSFPDGFRFCGTMNPAFKQIGNAVPPLMAHAVFSALVDIVAGRSGSSHRKLLDQFKAESEVPSVKLSGQAADKL